MIRKISFLSLLAVGLSALPAPAQDGAASKWAAALFNNDLVGFNNNLIHEFGTVAAGALAEHRFKLANHYVEDVEITSVTAACGCTKLSASKKLLKTYDTADIVAELDTTKFKGFKEATINVSLSFRPQGPNRIPVSATVQLKLRAFIRGDIVFEPGVVQFDSMPPGQSAEKHVTLSYAGRDSWKILEAASSSPFVAVSVRETGRNFDPNWKATQVTYDLVVTLKDIAPTGYFKEQITLKTNDQNQQNARVPLVVQGHIIPSLSVSPTMLMLNVLKPGESVSKVLVVRADKPFRVLRVSGPDDQFRFTKADEAKTVHQISVQFTAGNRPGKVAGKIRIATDLGDATVDVDVDGQIVAGDSPPPAAGPAKADRARIDLTRPSASGLDAAKPGGNVLRPGRLQKVEPDEVKTPPAPK